MSAMPIILAICQGWLIGGLFMIGRKDTMIWQEKTRKRRFTLLVTAFMARILIMVVALAVNLLIVVIKTFRLEIEFYSKTIKGQEPFQREGK